MKTRVTVLWDTNTDWSLEEIEFDPPRAGEVLVKLFGSGLCHSDEHLRTGDMVVPRETAELLGQLTWGTNADKTIIAVGVGDGDLIAPVLAMTAKGDRCVHTSVAPIMRNDVQPDLLDLTLQQKELVGSLFGSANPRYATPRILRLYQKGKLKLDELVTREYNLDETNQGCADMNEGRNVQVFVRHNHGEPALSPR